MALTQSQQFKELIQRSTKHILITTREHAGVDAVSAAVAMGRLLKKLNKSFDIVVPGKTDEKIPSFLPQDTLVSNDVGATRTFHIRVDTTTIPLSELMYDVKDGILDITLVPTHHTWTPADVTTQYGEDRYDLIIAIDCPDMSSLGALGRDHADLFYRTTVCNIDCHASNEYWGQVNLVDLTAVSTTEVLYHWMREQEFVLDEQIATALLAGMIVETKSFRTPNVTPKTLITSSELIELGARRDEIVLNLWRTRDIATLKLWGRALSRLEQDRELGLVWSSLATSDFVESGVNAERLDGVVDELLSYAPEAKIVVLIWQNTHGLCVSIHTNPPYSAADLARPLNGVGNRQRATCEFNETTNLIEGTQKIIERLQTTIRSLRT